jgi:hypothetical protein
MSHVRPARYFSLLILGFLVYCSSAPAQSPVDPGNLPGRTLFYLYWHGTPSGEVRKTNSLFAFWDDPELAPTRDSLIQSLLTNATNPNNKLPVNREELGQNVTLLDNPFVIGYVRQPESRAAAKNPASAAGKTTPAPSWNGVFFIYDRSGKEELLSKTVTHLRTAEKDIPKLSELTVAGVSSLKIERTSGTTYWAEFGKYAVSANELSVFEEILNITNGKIGASKLSQAASYQEARPVLDGGIMEFFLRVPTTDEIVTSSPASSTAQVKLLLSALKLDSVHSVAGRVSLQGTKSRLTGAVLGDTAPGGLFDIWADGQANPVSIGYLSPDTVYYGESQFDLLGIYNTLKRAFSTSPTGVAGNPAEQMAATRLGMPLADALGLVTGEFAWIQTSPTLDDSQKVYLFGIRNKPDALKLTRSLMGDRITSERAEGDATYMKISLHGGQSSAGLAQWNFYYLAMTPNLLFGATKSDILHKYVGQAPATPDSAQLKSLLAARAQFPEKLNGFSYFDFQKLDWPGLRAKWVADANKAVQTAKSTDAANTDKKVADWLSQVNPEVFSRHLHSMSGASWKDAKGVHFDEWLD